VTVLPLVMLACQPGPAPVATQGPTLVNGDFSQGLDGWHQTGDADRFRTFRDPGDAFRWSLTTAPADRSVAMGTVYQDFIVPADGVALRFYIHGGRSHVKLMQGPYVVREAVAMDDNLRRVPVSFDLRAYRSHKLRILVVDDEADPEWGFISVSGFDVIREASPIVNPWFEDDFDGWTVEGQAPRLFTDLETIGQVKAVTTWDNERDGDALIGKLWQEFTIPDDAIVLRFNIHGGQNAFVRLFDAGDGSLLREAWGANSNTLRIPIVWDLVPLRGRTVKLAVDDPSTGSWSYIGSSGFDVITEGNGP
jgi:hypothetical protein